MIIAHNTHGLCNRIKNMIGAMMIDPDIRVYWEKRGSLLCEFNDLFENNITTDRFDGSEVYTSWRFLPRLYHLDYNFDSKDKIPLRKKVISHLNKLRPVKYVRESVKWISNLFDEKTISVHIRSWGDNSPNKKEHWTEGMNGFHIEHFIREMKNHDGTFFVATDKDSYIKILNDHFIGRIIHHIKRDSIPGSKEFAQDALIDLYLLAKNPVLIGSRKSTFSEIAWYLGECKSKPIMLGGKLRAQ